ncbi:hypothetical protein MTCD1_02872 [Colwellia marinimaniae]|uniref:Histidine kinase n=2 Tax=Colwelliaceae TaxID=267889 RepID=A0ABQ0MY00_9GAMM|nr:hypothetical protein MTCD1_02872 [Colwellia marinimaniae]
MLAKHLADTFYNKQQQQELIMKKTITTMVITSLLAASAISFQASATEGLSANFAATNNYLWRGLEQTGGDVALSGGIDYATNSGFYAGTWVSNASWGDMKTELDLYLGFSGDINASFSYDVGYIYFAYPDSIADKNAFSEIYASISTGGFTFGLAVLADSEGGGDGAEFGDSLYANIDYAFTLANDAEVAFHIGNYSGDFSTDSTDIGVSISKDGFTFGVSKTDYDDGIDSDDMKFYLAYSIDIDL